ncbi:MAG: HAMP domain-containing sensor histidine kinase, partial [Clostridia bacterium]|nr:HAMP domain-containing sensor histidine kinase [Clostridia bacterium]
MSKYSIGLLAIAWSLIGLLYVSVHKVARLDNYTSANLFSSLDYSLFMLFSKPKFSFFTLIRMFNVISVIYMASLVFFSLSYLKLKKIHKLITFAAVAAFSCIYVFLYDPGTLYSVYIYSTLQNFLPYHILSALDLVLWGCVIFVFLVPLFILLLQYKKLESPYSKRQLIGVFLFVILTSIVYLTIFKITNMRTIYITSNPATILSPGSYIFNFSQTYILLMIMCIGCMVYVTTSFNITSNNGFLRKQMIRATIRNKNTEAKKILHSVKNVILSFHILSEEALYAEGEKKNEQLMLLNEKIESYLKHICSFGAINSVQSDFWQEETSAEEFMDSVIDKINCPQNITIKKLYGNSDNTIYIDPFYLTDAMTNIIKNAIQTTEETGGDSIEIAISNELKWVVFSVADKGTGIKYRNKKEIFKPFYTTKSMNTNWGLGLSYAHDIINMHNGKISLKTKLGKG